VWLEIFSLPRGSNSKTRPYLLSFLFQLSTPKGSTKAPAEDLLRLNALRGTKLLLLPPPAPPSRKNHLERGKNMYGEFYS